MVDRLPIPAHADLLTLWDNGAADREIMESRDNCYNGDQDILDDTEARSDGADKNLVVTNWIRYIVDRHVGFMLNKPVVYSLKESTQEEGQDAALVSFNDLIDWNYLGATDTEHLRQCILKGSSVEVHSFDGSMPVISLYAPENWVFIRNDADEILLAIYYAILPVGLFWQDKVLTEESYLFTVYSDSEIVTYTPKDENTVLEEISRTTHNYGQPPVVCFQVNASREPFISNALVSQQNVYNKIRSRNADDVEYNVDALLCLIGYAPDALFELDADGKSYLDKMREHRVLTLKEGGEANFLTKGNVVDKVKFDLDLTREAIHLMGKVADIYSIVGSTGQTSGIALKLKLQPQIEQAAEFSKYFEMGLRQRLDLINTIWAAQGKPQLTAFNIGFSLNIPVNEVEIWQALPNLSSLLGSVDLLRLVPSVTNPEAAAKAKKEEDKNSLVETNFHNTVDDNEDNVIPVIEGEEE